ncbi:MAG: hypothetical protein AAGE86_10395 [Pseudomonadota bacterium]
MAISLSDRLRARLAQYDGRATTVLGEAETELGGENGYADALIGLAAEPDGHIADGATWLLKAALESGTPMTSGQADALFGTLPQISSWAAQLHVCQSVRFLPISIESARLLSEWVEPLSIHERPFLRAWALDILARISEGHPAYEALYRKTLEAAEGDPAASVRARARNLKARG